MLVSSILRNPARPRTAMSPIVRMVKINGLQFNANRDPQAYRRCAGEPFRIEALLADRGRAQVRLTDEQGTLLANDTVEAPATWGADVVFDRPGSRIVLLEIETGAVRHSQTLRLDVQERAWVG